MQPAGPAHRSRLPGADGEVCWIDLGTPQTERSAAFYRALFGWRIQDPDPGGYRLASADGELVAALGPAEDRGAPYWSVYLRTSDIDAAVRAAVRPAQG